MTENNNEPEKKVEEAQATENQEVQSETPAVEETQPKAERKTIDHNWSQARAALASQKAEIDALRAKLTEKEDQDEFKDLAPDEYVTVAQAQKIAERKAERKAEQIAHTIVEKRFKEQETQLQETQVRNQYEDYDYVIENFALPMVQQNKALADALRASPNPFVMAYNLAKSSEEYQKEMVKQKPNAKAEKILKNVNRPLSSSAAGASLKTQADMFANLTPSQTWEMSQKYAKKAS
jgi:hypothetical protein